MFIVVKLLEKNVRFANYKIEGESTSLTPRQRSLIRLLASQAEIYRSHNPGTDVTIGQLFSSICLADGYPFSQ